MSSLWMERASHALTVALNVTCTDASNAHTICGTKKECVSLPVPQATSKWISSKNATSVALTVLHVQEGGTTAALAPPMTSNLTL